MKVFPLAVSLTVQAMLLNVRWAGRRTGARFGKGERKDRRRRR